MQTTSPSKFFVAISSVLLIGSMSFAANSFAQAISKTTKIAPPIVSKVKGLLYEIQMPLPNSKPAEKKRFVKAYLFGSIHIAKADFYPMSVPVMKAYKESGTIVVEADVSNTETSSEIVDKLSYVPPDKLEAHLAPATWDMLISLTGANSVQFQRYKPVMVAMGLTINVGQQLGYEPAQGLDLYFITQCRKDKKELVELEGVKFQGDVLAELSDAEGDALLASTLDTFRKGEAQKELNRIAESWKQADAVALGKILRESGNRDAGSQALMKRLTDERNTPITEKLGKLMGEGKKLFVVLNAGRFAGDQNILEILQKQGFQIKQIR